MSAAGDLKSRRGTLERRQRARVIDLLLSAARRSSGQALLGSLSGQLGSRAVDLLGPLRILSEDDDAIRADLREAADDQEVLFLRAAAVGEVACAKGGEEGGVAGQHAE